MSKSESLLGRERRSRSLVFTRGARSPVCRRRRRRCRHRPNMAARLIRKRDARARLLPSRLPLLPLIMLLQPLLATRALCILTSPLKRHAHALQRASER